MTFISWEEFVAGSVGGIAGVYVGKPFDIVKVHLQDGISKGVLPAFRRIITEEGIRGLYKGVMSPVYGQGAINAIVFGAHDNVLRRITDDQHSISANFAAGAAAGFCQSFVASPVELVRIRIEVQNVAQKEYKGPTDCFLKIFRQERHFFGINRGLFAMFLREIPSFGVYFSSYEYLSWKLKTFLGLDRGSELSTGPILIAGGFAGMLTWFSTYPIDLIKTRIQADKPNNPKYKGIIDCAKQTYREGGFRLFYRGLGVTMVRAFPVNAATFAAYEYTKRLLNKRE